MNSAKWRRLMFGLTLAVALFTVACGWLYWKRAWLAIEVAFAAEQAEIFDEMRAKALVSSDAAESVNYLQYAINYYPSGTKQRRGSLLDQLVERHRASIVREIIAELQKKTGRNLGDDPQVWIDEYVGLDSR